MHASGTGDLLLLTQGGARELLLQNVFYTETFSNELISIIQLRDTKSYLMMENVPLYEMLKSALLAH